MQKFFQRLIVSALAFGLVSGAVVAEVARVNRPPHIVVIVADDLGFADVGFHGSDIRTPNIDLLAASGATLERFYAMPFCSPTRAALLTGRHPFRYGLQTAAIPADGSYGLNTNEVLLPNLLQQAGYRTAIVGKWHLGHARKEFWPLRRGFDYQYGPFVGEIDYFTHSIDGQRDWNENDKPLQEEGYATELIGRKAEQLILAHDTTTPLFLYLTFTAPHAPYQVPAKYELPYASIADSTRRTYAGMVACMDEQIGKVLAALESKRMRENTLILFLSDNGGNRTAAFSGEGDVSDLVLPASNTPFRGGKGNLLEGGCRVVAVANWPGHIQTGKISAPMQVVDVLPTLARMAGVSTGGTKPLDGVDQGELLTKGVATRTEVIYNIEPYRAALSRGDWKLLLKTSLPPQAELYHLTTDPGEATNVAAEHPDQVAELRQRIFQLATEAEPPLFFGYAIRHHDRMKEILQSLQSRK